MNSSPAAVDTWSIVEVCRNERGVDRALLREMLDHFIDENTRRMQSAFDAVASGDGEGLRNLAHAVRGSAALIGAGRLHDLASAIEHGHISVPAQSLKREVDRLREEFEAVVGTLREIHPEAWTE